MKDVTANTKLLLQIGILPSWRRTGYSKARPSITVFEVRGLKLDYGKVFSSELSTGIASYFLLVVSTIGTLHYN